MGLLAGNRPYIRWAEQVAIESSYRRVRTFQSRSRSSMSKRFGWCSR